jgi:hypothetical protein
MRCSPDRKYETPPGYRDQWFTYAYDADALADGANYNGLVVPIEADADFIVRRISGGPQVLSAAVPPPGQMRVYDRLSAAHSSAPVYNTFYRSVAVVPERLYPAGGAIPFDLFSVLRSSNIDPVTGTPAFNAQLAFQGVRRRRGQPEDSLYSYYEKPFIYRQVITVDWENWLIVAGVAIAPNPPRQFYLPIQDYDFELHLLRAFRADSGGLPGTWAKVSLYDQNQRSLSNLPLWCDFLEYNAPNSFGAVFSPPLLYRVNTQLKLDLYSLYWAWQLPSVIEFDWCGVQRIPC